MKQFLSDIQNRLANASSDGHPLFAYVDMDWGQVDFYDGMPPVKFPCALIDLQSATFSNEGNFVQLGDVLVQVRVVDLILSPSSAQAPDGQREKAARIFDLLRTTHYLLHGWTGAPERYGRLVRKSITRARRRDRLTEYVLSFAATLTDDSARPLRQAATILQLSVNPE
jgi:hypothetical protein